MQIDSNFHLAEVDLKLPGGPITCLDCMTVNLDNVKEIDDQHSICVMGSTDNTVRFVTVKYGYFEVRFAAFHRHYRSYTIITLSCHKNIFGWNSLFGNLLHKYYSGTKNFLEILLFGRWLIVILLIDYGNSIPHTHVGGLFRACQSFPTAATYLPLCT